MRFIIAALPRSRTAWMAAWLSAEGFPCLHEPLGRMLPRELAESLAPGAGISDPCAALEALHLTDYMPDAIWVLVKRDPEIARVSYRNAIGDRCTDEQFDLGWSRIIAAWEGLDVHLAGTHHLVIEYDRLTQDAGQILRYLGRRGQPRFLEEFATFNIQKDADAALRMDGAHPASATATPESTHEIDIDRQYWAMVTDMLGDVHAVEWMREFALAGLTWDHIEDNDPIDKQMASIVFEAMLTRWPMNPFWRRHGFKLAPTIAAVISSWRASNLGIAPVKDYDAYTEVPAAMAHILGRHEAAARLMPRIRQTTMQRRGADR